MTSRAGRPRFARSLALASTLMVLAAGCYGGGEGEDTSDLVNEEVAGWSNFAAGLGRGIVPPSICNPGSACANSGGSSGSIYRQYSLLQFNRSDVTAAYHRVDHVGLGGPGSGATVEIQCGGSSQARSVYESRFTIQDLWVSFGSASSGHWLEIGAVSQCGGYPYRYTAAQYWYNWQLTFWRSNPTDPDHYPIGGISDYNNVYYTIFRYNPTWWVSVPGHDQEWGITWGGTAPKASFFQSGLESNDTTGILMRHTAQTGVTYSQSEGPFDPGQPWWKQSYSKLSESGNSHMHIAKDASGTKNGLHFCIAGDADCH